MVRSPRKSFIFIMCKIFSGSKYLKTTEALMPGIQSRCNGSALAHNELHQNINTKTNIQKQAMTTLTRKYFVVQLCG